MQFSPIISEFLFTSVLCVIVLILKSQSQLSQPNQGTSECPGSRAKHLKNQLNVCVLSSPGAPSS